MGQSARIGVFSSQPACAQGLARVFRRMRLKGPRRVRAQFVRHAQPAEQLLRFQAAGDHQRFPGVARAHLLDQVVHVAGIAAIGHGQFVFRRGYPQGPDHHRGQRIGELALEHRAFARHHAVIRVHFAEQKRRVHVRQVHLPRALEISFGAVEVLRHHAEFDILRTQHVAHLPQNLLYAHVAAGVARAVVAREQDFQFFARCPALAEAEHPAKTPDFDQRADPCHE